LGILGDGEITKKGQTTRPKAGTSASDPLENASVIDAVLAALLLRMVRLVVHSSSRGDKCPLLIS